MSNNVYVFYQVHYLLVFINVYIKNQSLNVIEYWLNFFVNVSENHTACTKMLMLLNGPLCIDKQGQYVLFTNIYFVIGLISHYASIDFI